MPAIRHLLPLLSATLHLAAVTTRPKLGRHYHQNLRGNMPGVLKISRDVTAIARLTGSKTYDPASILDGGTQTTTVTVTGAALGSPAQAAFSLTVAGIIVTAYVSAADTVTVLLQNESGGTVDLASGTLSAWVDAPLGTVAIWGANVPNPWAGRPLTNVFRGRTVADGTGIAVTDANAAAGDYTLQTNIAYAAFSNYNWIVIGNETEQIVLVQGATNGGFGVTDVGGFACITFSLRTVAADSVTTTFDLAGLPYDLYSNGVVGLQVTSNSVAQVLTTNYTVSSTLDATSGELVTRVTFLVAPTAGNVTIRPYLKANAQVGVAKVTPVAIKAAATNVAVNEEIVTRDASWAVMAANAGPTLAVIEPSGR